MLNVHTVFTTFYTLLAIQNLRKFTEVLSKPRVTSCIPNLKLLASTIIKKNTLKIKMRTPQFFRQTTGLTALFFVRCASVRLWILQVGNFKRKAAFYCGKCWNLRSVWTRVNVLDQSAKRRDPCIIPGQINPLTRSVLTLGVAKKNGTRLIA